MNDARQLLYELEVAIKIYLPDADHNQLKFLFEGILQNYEMKRKMRILSKMISKKKSTCT